MAGPGSWGIEKLILRMSAGSDNATIEFLHRYRVVFHSIARSTNLPAMLEEEKIMWLQAFLFERKLPYLITLIEKFDDQLEESFKVKKVGSYLKKILYSGKIAMIKECQLYEAFPQLDNYPGTENREVEVANNPLFDLLEPRESIVIKLRSYGYTDSIEFIDEEWEYARAVSGLSKKEIEKLLDKEILMHKNRARPISGEFVAEFLKISRSNVDKIYQRVRKELKSRILDDNLQIDAFSESEKQ
jgi:hypothetical protein